MSEVARFSHREMSLTMIRKREREREREREIRNIQEDICEIAEIK